jgi:hypothetical protein
MSPGAGKPPVVRRRWAPLVVLGLGALVAGWLLLTYHPAPVVPRDPDHLAARVPAGCLTCHGPEGSHPQPANHPINEACFSCHRWP